MVLHITLGMILGIVNLFEGRAKELDYALKATASEVLPGVEGKQPVALEDLSAPVMQEPRVRLLHLFQRKRELLLSQKEKVSSSKKVSEAATKLAEQRKIVEQGALLVEQLPNFDSGHAIFSGKPRNLVQQAAEHSLQVHACETTCCFLVVFVDVFTNTFVL